MPNPCAVRTCTNFAAPGSNLCAAHIEATVATMRERLHSTMRYGTQPMKRYRKPRKVKVKP